MSDEADLTPKRRDAAPMDDGTLIARMAGGDQSAVGELYDRYGRPVYALGYRILHDEAAAAEMTQEVFVKLWRHAARFDPQRGRPGTWLMQIAYTAAADLLRTRRCATPVGYETDLADASPAEIAGRLAKGCGATCPTAPALTKRSSFISAN